MLTSILFCQILNCMLLTYISLHTSDEHLRDFHVQSGGIYTPKISDDLFAILTTDWKKSGLTEITFSQIFLKYLLARYFHVSQIICILLVLKV